MSSLWNYIGLSGPIPVAEEKTPVRALPANWYTSKEMYELERRAIFSRRWMFLTHKSRIANPGDWMKYDVAGFQFVICRDRNHSINAFHNICRHRAFPVVTEDSGSSKIFSCQYHGWSYGLNGKLAKAPGYQELIGFDKDQNGLLPIHVHVDVNGFIWVNLDSKEQPEVAWSEDFGGVDTQERLQQFNFDDYAYDHSWGMEGDWNWKILADNYNECYHCPTSHPDIPALADLQSYKVTTKDSYIVHDTATTVEQRSTGMTVCPTYFFPNASMNVSPNFFFIQRFVPSAPGRSAMRYEVYRHKDSTEENFDKINQMYKRIMTEDKYLCEQAQKNINAGIFVNGEMHPRMEKGPLFFQKNIRDAVTSHYAREQKAKQEIWPARQALPVSAGVSKKDIDFCAGLSCATSAPEILAW